MAWYNGHPDYREQRFDLSQERVAVVGVGNVAVDVVRILCRTPDELAATDISDDALAALRESRVREVYLLGRRGPAQAAFTNPEIRELGELPGADIVARPDEVELDPLTRAELEKTADRGTLKKVEILREYAQRVPSGKPRTPGRPLPGLAGGAPRRRGRRGGRPPRSSATSSTRRRPARSRPAPPTGSRSFRSAWSFARWGTGACRSPACPSTTPGGSS